ncbi:hypothetical protein HQ524_01700 [Candidatus Uhrbacteria bacterium]|nr:hypothetical protein [Candidatus Uhrbacteria bacterium]
MSTEETKEKKAEAKTVSIKLPVMELPSIQAIILILLIVVGGLQTAQLYGLNVRIASGDVGAKSSSTVPVASSSSGSGGSVTSTLPTMVGGC